MSNAPVIMKSTKRIAEVCLCICMMSMLSSCHLENDEVQYNFIIHNTTETPVTLTLSSWGAYHIYIDGTYDSRHKFSKQETISPHNFIQFSQIVDDNPDAGEISLSIIPVWEYITSIECGGVSIPKEFFANRTNWDISVARQINGVFSDVQFVITPDLIKRFE